MVSGWTGRILDVNLSSGEIDVRDSAPYTREYLGGRAMASRIAWERISHGIDAYDPGNHIIVATGPLTGTLAPTTGRTVMAGLSPRTYPRSWYTHSTLGGWFGPALKYAGFDALVLHGRADQPVYLEVRDGKARLKEAGSLWGLDARQTQLALKEEMGAQAQVLAIGPAGENRVRFATVQHSEENAAGHSGFGGVWGSKNLKAVAVLGTGGVPVARPEALLEEVLRSGTNRITPMSGVLRAEGKPKTRRPVCSQACTFNCFTSAYGQATDGRLLPGHCIGGMVWLHESNMRLTRYSGGGIEIPGASNFGLEVEGRLHELCNSLGLDLWFRLVMQPWLMRCRQLGVDRIGDFPIDPEDASWFERFMHQLARREGLGELFAEDLSRAMDELEGEIPEELIRLGREMEFAFGFPAHREGRFWDEEPLPFWVISAMMYASESRDPTIGTHQSGLLLAEFLLRDRELAERHFRRLSEKVWGYPEALESSFEKKAPVAIWSQNQHMLIDSLPLCDFAFPQLVRPMETVQEWRSTEDISGDLDIDLRLLAAVTGIGYQREELTRIAERAFNLERAMLALAGRHRGMEESLAPHFALPCRADGTMIDGQGFSGLLDQYYEARGWDQRSGWPTPELLDSIGLPEVIPVLEGCR